MLIQGVRNLQPADECECRDIIVVVKNFGWLALTVIDVRLEAVALPHFDDENVVVVLLASRREAY